MLMPSEVEIFSRLIDPGNPTMTPEAAAAVLQLTFAPTDHARMQELARKSNEGELTPDERRELESYVFVGDVLGILKSKARSSLRKHNPAA